MKFQFDPGLDYQQRAIESVCGLFRGQQTCGAVTGNRLSLSAGQILANLQAIQQENGLRCSDRLASGDFTIDMETGTGKTYVYLRTVFELNRRFGFSKFVIVVPSVAIREGVCKTLEMTREHLRSLYANVPFEHFVYDSAALGPLRGFATSAEIRIMVVTVGAINKKDVNNLYKDTENTGGERPIDLIRATRPIVIVDEPQSVDGGLEGQGRRALEEMHPLCTLRYSATHVPDPTHHAVYRLDAVDAYERGLVKQIEVAAAGVEGLFNAPCVELLSVTQARGSIRARIVIHRDAGSGPEPVVIEVRDGDCLAQASGRDIYAGYRIGELRAARGEQRMLLVSPGGDIPMKPGDVHGGIHPDEIDRQMIRRTIREHLAKEAVRRPLGIKVLSLFFIRSVEDYRQYDEAGRAGKGRLARIFEEEYQRAARRPEHQDLFAGVDPAADAASVHDGYFSMDRRGRMVDTDEASAAGREDAERAFRLIMREKEALLGFSTKLKFIFSHSALAEGWDNPNVFQICVLRDMNTGRRRRQTLGRGLRLCVNQDGERVRDADINTLTVIAGESYEAFAANLQKEFGEDTGRRARSRIDVRNADERRVVRTRADVLHGDAFTTLWDGIKHRTRYRVQFDNDMLIRDCIAAVRHSAPVNRAQLSWRKAAIAIGRGGVRTGIATTEASVALDDDAVEWPDLLTALQARTPLTRRSLVTILTGRGRLDDVTRNPQQAIDQAADAINATWRLALLAGIRYRCLGDHHDWPRERFADKPLTGYLADMLPATKSVHEYIVCDPHGIDRRFAEALEQHPAVKVYAKLPGWFTIPTPLGDYNPGWAVLIEKAGGQRVCCVVETRGSPSVQDLRTREGANIACGRAHVEALAARGVAVRYVVATGVADLLTSV